MMTSISSRFVSAALAGALAIGTVSTAAQANDNWGAAAAGLVGGLVVGSVLSNASRPYYPPPAPVYSYPAPSYGYVPSTTYYTAPSYAYTPSYSYYTAPSYTYDYSYTPSYAYVPYGY